MFFNKLGKGNCKQMGATRSGSSVTAAWSPCGRYLLTATTAPRLRVDNNVRIFNYVGEQEGGAQHQVFNPSMHSGLAGRDKCPQAHT